MGLSGGFPIDLILFGMIAAFLVLRLRNVLGRRTGYERPPQAAPQPQPRTATGPTIDGRADPTPQRPARAVPDPASPLGQTLARMTTVDRNFDPAGFLNGAEQAFRMIVGSFAAGDRNTLKMLLSDDTYQAFEAAISAREAAGQTQVSEIRSIQSATIEEAELRGTVAAVAVRIVSDQVSQTLDANRNTVVGTDAVTEITDVWTFERDLTTQDPTWRLVAARSA